MEGFACIEATDGLRLERHDTHRIPVASDELHLVGFVVAMHEDDRVDNANQEAMLRERSRQHGGIMFLDRQLHAPPPSR